MTIKHKTKEEIINSNYIFKEKTRRGSVPYELFYSEKFRMYYILIEKNIVFQDGVIYSGSEILELVKQDHSVDFLQKIHGVKKMFETAIVLK